MASRRRLRPAMPGGRRPLLLPTGSSSSLDTLGVSAAANAPNTPTTPMTPAIKPVEHEYRDDASERPPSDPAPASIPVKEPTLALRVARSGHLFATITATSMTIWQTKVGSSRAQRGRPWA